MWHRYWNFTTCIYNQNLSLIEQEIIDLLQKQGGTYIYKLPSLTFSLEELQAKHPAEQSSHVWIVCLYPGKEGWTIVKTYPSELLCHAVNYDYDCYSQLSMLTMQLNSDAFHLSVHGDDFGFLVEAGAKGNNLISGSFALDLHSDFFYLQSIEVPGLIKQFSLLELPEKVKSAINANQSCKWKQRIRKIKEQYDPYWDKDLTIGYFEMIDEALKITLDSSNRWYLHNLAYSVYTRDEFLIDSTIKLLYFSPPASYKTSIAYDLTQTETLEAFGVASESMLNGTFDEFGLEAIDG